MKRPRKSKLPGRRNPLARLLRTPRFKKQVETSRRSYQRKPKHPKPAEPDA